MKLVNMVPLRRLPSECRKMRKVLGLSVRPAAKLIGTSAATLSRVENKFPCDARTYERISDWLIACDSKMSGDTV